MMHNTTLKSGVLQQPIDFMHEYVYNVHICLRLTRQKLFRQNDTPCKWNDLRVSTLSKTMSCVHRSLRRLPHIIRIARNIFLVKPVSSSVGSEELKTLAYGTGLNQPLIMGDVPLITVQGQRCHSYAVLSHWCTALSILYDKLKGKFS